MYHIFIFHLSKIYAGLGFWRDHVLLVNVDASRTGYSRGQLAGPYRQILERVRQLPQVASATLSGVTPGSGAGANRDARVEGYEYQPGEMRWLAENWVAPGYFETLGTPLLRGRDFSFDDERGPRVAIINQTMARQYFRDRDPVGKHVTLDGDPKPYEIVGVAGDTKYINPQEHPSRIIYFNAFQEGHIFSNFCLRTGVPRPLSRATSAASSTAS